MVIPPRVRTALAHTHTDKGATDAARLLSLSCFSRACGSAGDPFFYRASAHAPDALIALSGIQFYRRGRRRGGDFAIEISRSLCMKIAGRWGAGDFVVRGG